MKVISPETRMMGLPYGEEIMIVGRTMWKQSTSVTDGRTDRITITKTVQRIASHGKNLTIQAIRYGSVFRKSKCTIPDNENDRREVGSQPGIEFDETLYKTFR